MKKKWMIIPYSATHFLVDLSCALFMYHYAFSSPEWYLLVILYNFCAFALQMPFGLLVDKWNRNAVCAAMGCVLVSFAFIFSPYLLSAVLMLGIGNAFFHVGAGTDVLNSSKEKASLLGIFVSPGAFGIYFGTMYGAKDLMIFQVISFILIVVAVLLVLLDYLPEHTVKSHNVPVSFETEKGSGALIATVCFFIVVCVRSYLGMKKFTFGGTAHWGVFLICAVVFGKTLGGIFADIFGINRVAVCSLAASIVCFAGSSIPILGVMGILFFNMTMPITLWAIAKIFKNCKGFSFGMLTVALFFGLLPGYFSNAVSFHVPIVTALISAGSLVILMIGMKKVVK